MGKQEEEISRSLADSLSRLGVIQEPLDFQFHKLDLERRGFDAQPRHRYRQLKSAWSRTSRIDIEDAISLELCRLMGMPADDDLKSCGGRIQVQCMQVVQDVE